MKNNVRNFTKQIGKIKLNWFYVDGKHIININLGRYDKKKDKLKNIQTATLYDCILEKDHAVTDIWIDKYDKKVIGIEITANEERKKK